MESSTFVIGSRVTTKSGKNGVVKFVGNTKFGDGLWLGLELDEPGFIKT
jgi:dynactin complex subunit